MNVEVEGIGKETIMSFSPATIILRKKMEYRLMRWEGDCE